MNRPVRSFSEESKAIAVYGLIILLGIVLSVIVYTAVTDVEKTTRDLVDRQIPALSLIQQTAANVTEQERLLYEYYATTDNRLYVDDYAVLRVKTIDQLNELTGQHKDDSQIAAIHRTMSLIHATAQEFERNIEDSQTDWDLAREQLAQISANKRQIDTMLKSLEQTTTKEVAIGYENTMSQITTTIDTVTWYSIAILVIALATGWYMRVYLKVSRNNKRLAEFSERNPHPIISIDEHNEIIYCNPATHKLLTHKNVSVEELIPQAFQRLFDNDRSKNDFISIEHDLGEMSFNIEIHWLSEIRLFDLHVSDITNEKKAKERLKFQAFHNPETGLQNNYRLRELLDSRVKQSKSFALGLGEIREFNHLLSAHGIDAVKELLLVVAQKLESIVQNSQFDIELFQSSERTFAFLIDGDISASAIEQQCQSLSERLRQTISTPLGEFNIELDMGFCNHPEHGNNSDSLMQYAQLALDAAIDHEHGSYSLYSKELSDKLNSNLTLINWLKSAIDNNELHLVYQPQLDLHNGRIIGMETLVRWQHDGHFISPAEFIPIAEQSGLIVEIGQWLLKQACSMAKELAVPGHDQLVLAVNISPRQFRHPNFLTMVKQVLNETGLKPQQLELEITEGVILYNESETINMLHQLKALDVQLSIDDFGTGYSSLSYLKQFPLDKLKIDQSFIRNLHTNDEDKAIVRAIIDLGKNLNLRTIAEGVEEKVHLDFLQSLDCDEIQGYYFSKPLLPQQFKAFFINHQQNMSQSVDASGPTTPLTN